MADSMARQETAPIPNPGKKPSRAPLVTGAVLAGGLVAAAAGAAILGRGQPPVETSTPAPTTLVSEPPKTAAPATEAPRTPEPPLTNEQKIELAKKAQQEALAKGEFRIPVAQQVVDAGGRMEQGMLLSNGERDLFVILPPGKDIVFPSLIDGKVVEAGPINPVIKMISIQAEGKNINILTSSNSSIMVKKGDSVSLGTPLLSISYNPDSTQQKTFEERGAEVKPAGTVAILAIQDATAGPGRGFQESTLEKTLLKDFNGTIITIPTLKANP